eukprot:COSAG01_NODE_12041_length_1809_cov_3.035673_1_plen_95_part_10
MCALRDWQPKLMHGRERPCRSTGSRVAFDNGRACRVHSFSGGAAAHTIRYPRVRTRAIDLRCPGEALHMQLVPNEREVFSPEQPKLVLTSSPIVG